MFLTCSQLLSAVLLLLRLWDRGTRETDNERSAQGMCAPLLPLLHRFQNIQCSKDLPNTEDEEMEVALGFQLLLSPPSSLSSHALLVTSGVSLPPQILTAPLSPNESFLRYLTLPQDNDLAIDLRQTAVVIMAHLDRLAGPCCPPQCSSPTSHKVPTPLTGPGPSWHYPALPFSFYQSLKLLYYVNGSWELLLDTASCS